MGSTRIEQNFGTSVKALTPNPKRRRVTFRFQLDFARDNVEFYTQLHQWLAAKKAWKRYAMDGLRLFYDLKQGSTVVLLELFPNIREMLGIEQGGGDGGLRDEIRDLKRLMLEQGGISIPPTTGAIMQPAYKPVNVDALVATVTKAAAASAESIADNFLSMFQ